mgnify:CR=1 FL=1
MDVSIVIPTLNEAKNLPLVIPEIPHLPEIAEVVLVDGHSSDGTVEVARQLLPEIRVISQDGKGKGNAILCAARAAKGDYFLLLDADVSHRPEEIPLYIEKAKEGYDLVKGSRYIPGGSTGDATFFRGLVIRTANTVANLVWRTRFTDICYGMFLIRRESFLSLNLKSQAWDVEWEMMIKAKRNGLKIAEIPSQEKKRLWGESKLPNYTKSGWIVAKRVFAEALVFWKRP